MQCACFFFDRGGAAPGFSLITEMSRPADGVMTPPSVPCSPVKKAVRVETESAEHKKTSSKKRKSDASSAASRVIRIESLGSSAAKTPAYASPILVDDDRWVPALSSGANVTLRLERPEEPRKVPRQVLLSGETERMVLLARNFGEAASTGLAKTVYKYAVALVPDADSKAEEPVRIWEAQLLRAERHVKASTGGVADALRLGADSSAAGIEASAASTAIDYRTAQNLLGEAFGTRKRQKAIVSIEKNQIKVDSMGSEAMSFVSRALDASVQKLPEAATRAGAGAGAQIPLSELSAFASGIGPTADLQTEDVSMVYKLSDLISEDVYASLPIAEFTALGNSAPSAEVSAWQARLKMDDFMRDRILACVWNNAQMDAHTSTSTSTSTSTASDPMHQLRLLIYVHYLAAFRELREAAVNGPQGSVAALTERLPGCSPALARHLLANFADKTQSRSNAEGMSVLATQKQRHKLPQSLRDKATLHLLATLLHCDGFRSNATAVAALLRVSLMKATAFYKMLGCVMERPERGPASVVIGQRSLPLRYAQLTAPPTFPPPKAKTQRR